MRDLVQRLVLDRPAEGGDRRSCRPAAACSRPVTSSADSNRRRSSSRRGWVHSPVAIPARKSPPYTATARCRSGSAALAGRARLASARADSNVSTSQSWRSARLNPYLPPE